MKRQLQIPTHHANGEPTLMPEKIISSLYQSDTIESWSSLIEIAKESEFIDGFALGQMLGKGKHHHIVPEDFECDPGDDIEFLAVTPEGNELKFAPLVNCTRVQLIQADHLQQFVNIGNSEGTFWSLLEAPDEDEVEQFCRNEGYESKDKLWNSVKQLKENKDAWLKGKLIHWTGKRY